MSQLHTLMYHSIFQSDEEWQQIKDEDKPYALHIDHFCQHLDYLLEQGITILNPNELGSPQTTTEKSVLITFDDGHIGFFKYAMPALKARGLSAIFFITSDLINNPDYPEFCNWSQLKEMATQGMCLQSHGQTHKFFEDMDIAQAESEFASSKAAIETNTGCHVWSISFPGGRYNSANIQQGKNQGYSHFFTSDFGLDTAQSLATGGTYFRQAIRVDTEIDRFKSMIQLSRKAYIKSKGIFLAKKYLKMAIGNENYHKLYKRLAG